MGCTLCHNDDCIMLYYYDVILFVGKSDSLCLPMVYWSLVDPFCHHAHRSGDSISYLKPSLCVMSDFDVVKAIMCHVCVWFGLS